jgi:hypothetical protein
MIMIMITTLPYICSIFSDSDNTVHVSRAPAYEVYIKEEPADDGEASTSQEQHLLIKAEKSIDIKHEPPSCKGKNCSLILVSLHD